MNELISIVIPVYKVEAYLSACVESVLAQTYQNFEVILVDDGSPDNCPAMCDAWAEKDSRIRVIHKENGGLSSARNAGIDVAKGDYLAFLDSDDLWTPVFLERLHTALTESNADLAVCQFQRFHGSPPKKLPQQAETEVLCQRGALECLFDIRNENMVVAPNKLYRRHLFKSIRYPLSKLHEDEAVIHEIIGAAKKVAWVEESHYHYRQAPNSITTSQFSLKRLDETYAKEQRIAFFEARGMYDLADRTKIVYLNNLMRLYRTAQNELDDKTLAKQTCRELYRKFKSIYTAELVCRESFKLRLRCMLFQLFPNTFSAFEYIRLKRREHQ
jgi:glycosyltransferase involved in cell wall biosynthesis